ncbi:hypothetical protein C2E23DRAFT_502252 [Lenzites betulinus]|nr:hypothetical protein C2E23DRAFT_502252 [Lenzites betulinus]
MDNNLDRTVGALLIGALVTAVGYGVTTTQSYMYSSLFPKDPGFIRWTVWTLFALDTVHIACSWHMVYHYLVRNFNNNSALEEAVWSFSATIVVTAVITVIVHCFYARRIFILGRRKWYIPSIVLALSLLRLVFGLLASAQIIRYKTYHVIQHKTVETVVIGLGAGTVADCIITASLVYLLRAHKSQMSPSLNTILARITYWTVNNGLLTCIVEVAFLVTQFSPIEPNMVFIALHFLLSKLYANSLLATLNSREVHRSGHGVDTAEQHSAMVMAGTSIFRASSMRFSAAPPEAEEPVVVFTVSPKDDEVAATILHIESAGGVLATGAA